MKRSQKILLAGYLALGFIALRLIYGFLFSGLWGTTVLISLPQLRLSGPFSHVTVLGDVTTEGIIRNLELAAPFAISILFFGIAAAFITHRSLMTAAIRIRPLRNFLATIAVSLSALPALFDAGSKVLRAQKLRSEKKPQLLVPILERSVELANTLGLKLALESDSIVKADCLTAHGLALPDIGLGPIELTLLPGKVLVLSGPTGSGKSSVLEALAGISSEYQNRVVLGQVTYGQDRANLKLSQIASFLRYIPQNPRDLLWSIEVDDILARVPTSLARELDLSRLAGRSCKTLSEGEAFKLLLAENLALKPQILLLDEPFVALDTSSRHQLTALLTKLSSAGMAILIVEHEVGHVLGLEAEHLHIAGGKLRSGPYRPSGGINARHVEIVGRERIFSAELPDLRYDKLLVQSTIVQLSQAECVWLSGENGSGKSTLLRALSEAAESKSQGKVSAGSLRLVPENFDDFFVSDSLQGELTRSDRIAKVSVGFTKTTLESVLPGALVESLLSTHPRDLSRGTRLSLAIAMQLSHKPQVLLIDEPFRGLDPEAKVAMVETLRCVLETGCAILFASHEADWSQSIASKGLVIANQKLLGRAVVSA